MILGICKTLVVDLDGALLRTNVRYERFWAALACDWRASFLYMIDRVGVSASLSSHSATMNLVDVATLPFNGVVIDYIDQWRKAGGRAVLLSTSDVPFAQAVAEHLQLFDQVIGSDAHTNLKEELKGAFLEERFGPNGYAYLGGVAVAPAIWERAAKVITVNASPALRRDAERACNSVEHLAAESQSVKQHILALRPHQWLKNTLVFLPMLAAHKIDGPTFLLSLLAFVCFSVVASSVYVLNDLLDLAADRAHPRKKNRPFASGSIPIGHGAWMAAGLLILGTLLAVSLGITFLLVMAAYYLLTLAYSLHLKRRIVIDICVLAGLYTARIVAGGVATGTPLSIWLLAFSIFFFLSLAAVKRQAELIDSAERGNLKAGGRGYHVNDLPIISMIAISAGYVSVLVLTLYLNSAAVVKLYAQPEALWGVCGILLYWITRTVLIAHRGHMHDDPVVYAAKDRISQICLLIALGFVIGGVFA